MKMRTKAVLLLAVMLNMALFACYYDRITTICAQNSNATLENDCIRIMYIRNNNEICEAEPEIGVEMYNNCQHFQLPADGTAFQLIWTPSGCIGPVIAIYRVPSPECTVASLTGGICGAYQ